MVTFRRLPYATAFERGRVQRELLVEATQGRESLDGIDWTGSTRKSTRLRLAATLHRSRER